MATAESKLLDEMDENILICAICSERYRDARILPCLHSYCEQCIGTLVEKAGGKTVLCPVCRRSHDLPEGLASISKNFFLSELAGLIEKKRDGKLAEGDKCGSCKQGISQTRCLDCAVGLCDNCTQGHKEIQCLKTHRLMSLETYNNTRSTDPAKVQPPVYCSSHHDNQVKFYCDTCNIPICLECIALDHKLTEHNHRYLNDAASEYKGYIMEMLDKLQEKELQAGASKQEVKTTSEALENQFQEEEKKLNEHIEKTIVEITAKIRENGSKLMAEMKCEYESRKQNLQAQIKELEIAENDMKHVRDFGRNIMHYGNAAQMMSAKKGMMSQIQMLIQVKTQQQPITDDYIEFQRSDFHETKNLGVILYHRYNFQLRDVPKYGRIGEELSASLTKSDDCSRPLAINEIRAKLRASEENVSVLENLDETLSLKYQGKVEGKHELSVLALNKHVEGSPTVITIIPNKGLLCKYGIKGSGVGQFRNIQGVRVFGNGVTAVCDKGNKRVQLFSLYGIHQRVIQFTTFTSGFDPRHVAVSKEGYYFITDNRNKQVVVCDENSKIIRCFGNQELGCPDGIAISPTNGRVYVCDNSSHCIRIYTQDGDYVKSFGSFGNGQCEFSNPYGMTINNKGNVIVAEYNHRIQVCDSDGVFLFSFGSQGNGNNQFNCPYDVACDNDGNMYVCDCFNHRVMKYDSHGVFLSRIDSDQDGLNNLTGVCVTDDKPFGKVVVADHGNNCIKVFAQ
ncbi:E3 ubiquitin-protein ligase TRIM71-like [Saccoglossus kowalevskii]|uniref:Tripartite motif-containing protein 2-like n=1 Tax=Saccoglossus kowalevskii TaxID=10224 RepID=A0ABM0GXH5_SACKO|nr:PREDICTED: tripartite motif-containing protein 2-like [Saccoglossus kowalevskii]